ncbi:MAG: hypothetical protein RR206_04845 [Bacteroidaceae bacterium]
MKNISVHPLVLAAGLLLCVALGFLWGRQGRRAFEPLRVRVVRDTVRLTDPAVVRTVEMPVPAMVDTAAIVRRYFTQKVYHDTIVSNRTVEVQLTDTVFMNSLMGRTATVRLNLPEDDNDFSVGMFGGDRSFGLTAEYQHRRTSIMGGYDFVRRQAVVGVKYRLFRW